MKKLSKFILTTLFLGASSSSFADWPIALTDQKTIHPEQFLGSYNEYIGDFSRTYQSINVLGNDFGTDLKIVETNAWSAKGGRTIINGAGKRVAYAPKVGFVGEDSFWYVMEDNEGRKNAAKVIVTVKSANSNFPSPSNDTVAVQKNKTIRIDVLKNDVFKANVYDGTGVISQYNKWSEKGGQIKLEGPVTGSYPQLIYTPPLDFTGTDTFWYVIQSKNSNDVVVKHAAKVTIKVSSSNQAGAYPVAKEDFATLEVFVCETVCVTEPNEYSVTTNDTGNNLKVATNAYSMNGGPTRALPKAESLSPRIMYTPSNKAIEAGEDKLWYTIEDEVGRKNWGVLNITLVPAQ